MNRLRQDRCEAMADAMSRIPTRFHNALGCDLLCEDPYFVGIMRPEWSNDTTDDGRSYRNTAHVLWPYHSKDSRSTIVMPEPDTTTVVIHELGHILHYHLKERAGGWHRIPRLEPVSIYAKTNRWEEFAEAFVAHLYPPRIVDEDAYWLGWSQPNHEFFQRIST